jgi:hypothetical protein
MKKLVVFSALISASASSQTLPTVCNPNAPGDCVRAAPIVKPDGLPTGTSGNLATSQVAVGTTPTLIAPARTARMRIVILQTAAGPCFYGASSTVSATTGFRITVAGASKAYQYAGALYGICPGGAVAVDVDEEY